jgi:hypothetical protein
VVALRAYRKAVADLNPATAFRLVCAANLSVEMLMIKLLRSRPDDGFKARGRERDADTDRRAVKSVADVIDLALERAENERTGLKKRMDDVIARAAVAGGNNTDEYLTRSDDLSEMLRNSDDEIKRGQERLIAIENNIAHFRFLKTALQSRFPNSEL